MNIPIFVGFIRGITYRPLLGGNLTEYNLDEFDINKAKSSGLIHKNTAARGKELFITNFEVLPKHNTYKQLLLF